MTLFVHIGMLIHLTLKDAPVDILKLDHLNHNLDGALKQQNLTHQPLRIVVIWGKKQEGYNKYSQSQKMDWRQHKV